MKLYFKNFINLTDEPLEYIKLLKEKFNPRVYHLTDGDYESELDRHLHGMGTFPLKELLGFIPDDAMVTNEAKREKKSSLIEFLSDSKKLHTFTK